MTMTEQPPQTAPIGKGPIDKERLRQKYLDERNKRLRADGNDQYLQVTGRLAHYLDDPYTPVTPRAPKIDHVTFAFIGGGFAGLVTAARLSEAGIRDVRIIEKGGDFGGTWYWNRYPGAQCDTASMVYMPLLEETGHMPSEKYAHAPEILAHCQRIGKKYGLYDNALFHTQVVESGVGRGEIALADPHHPRRCLHRAVHRHGHRAAACAEASRHCRHRKFQGALVPHQPLGLRLHRRRSLRARRWTNWPTSASASSAPARRRCSACRIWRAPARSSTCSSARRLRSTCAATSPIDPEWFAGIATPGWQQRWLENFTANQAGGTAEVDLVKDGWTDLNLRIRAKIIQLPREQRTPPNMLAAFEDSDFEKMEEIRARVDTIVDDRETAAKLKAWYRQLCKRPCFHDSYLQAFNTPGTHLVDTDGKGVEKITENGVVVAGREYQLDCIIYASGFEVGTEYKRRSGFDMTGRGGASCRSTGPPACAPSTASTCTASRTRSSCSRPRAPTSSPTCRII